MRMILSAVVLALSATSVQASDWVSVAENKTEIYSIQKGSVQIAKNDNDVPVVVVLGRIHNQTNDNISFERWYVPLRDCVRGYGTIVAMDLEGRHKASIEYVDKGGTVGSHAAALMCDAAEIMVRENPERYSL